MDFLANENFPLPGIKLLRGAGHTVLSISELCPGIPDSEVIQKAKATNTVILTFDKDYGELIYKYAEQNPPAVVFFRFKGQTPEYAANLLIKLMNSGLEVLHKFTVIEKENVRQRPY